MSTLIMKLGHKHMLRKEGMQLPPSGLPSDPAPQDCTKLLSVACCHFQGHPTMLLLSHQPAYRSP